jgi:hypothetical protein
MCHEQRAIGVVGVDAASFFQNKQQQILHMKLYSITWPFHQSMIGNLDGDSLINIRVYKMMLLNHVYSTIGKYLCSN